MVMQAPTIRQRQLIKRWKIPVPTTKQACSRLIGFLLEDQKRIGHRVRQIRGFHWRFRGARVEIIERDHEYRGRRGTVLALRMRSEQELNDIAYHQHNTHPYLYVAIVSLDPDGKVVTHVCLTGLKILNRGDQLCLAFPLEDPSVAADV